MFLKGVCRDPSAGFPAIRVCDTGSIDLDDPEAGVGVSVNKVFKNVNWVAVPGRRLFFHGNLEEGELLNQERAQETLRAADQLGVLDGVEIHDEYRPPEGDKQALARLAASDTLGTDFALSFGRTAFCARLPVSVDMMEDIVAHLNQANSTYALSGESYEWSGYHDNCAHILHNSLAAAGVWPARAVRAGKLSQLAHLAVPANEFADLATLSNTGAIDDFEQIYASEERLAALLERNWLPTRHGALLQEIPAHRPNELYDTRARLRVLEGPLSRRISIPVLSMMREDDFTEVEPNLRYFQTKYEAILASRAPKTSEPGSDSGKQRAREKYYKYIAAQLRDVKAKLTELRANRRARDDE